MNSKYYKNIFIGLIIFLIIVGIYIIYIKDNKAESEEYAKSKESKILKEITIGITEFDTINPILTKSLEIQHITKLIYEPLIDITQDFNLVPCIAEEWSKIDKLVYIIKLDENKYWHNGEKVKVEDIEYTINKIKNSDSIYKQNIEAIQNIEKINETTFKIYLDKEVEFFEYLLCFPIIKENTYNSEIPGGTGKYKIQSINNDKIIIQGEQTKVIINIYESITELYNSFTREDVDLIITQNTDYEEYIGNIGFSETIITGREFYYISCENIKDINERKFLESSLRKEKLIYDLYCNKYVVSEFPLDYGSYLNNKRNKKENSYKSNRNNYTLSVDTENYNIALIIKEILKEKNININIQEYKNPKADLILKTKTVSITPEIKDYFIDEDIKTKIIEIEKIENKEILKKEYENIINKYYDDIPFISLFFNSYIILHNDKLKGDFSGNWYNMFYNIDTWYKVI